MNHSIRNRKGFTLIELLTVIAIIGILAAVLFPGVQGVMRSAKKNSALNKLRSIGQGYLNWAQGKTMTAATGGSWSASGTYAKKISEYAGNLAAGAQLDSGEIWFVDGDALLDRNPLDQLPKSVLKVATTGTTIDTAFTAAITKATATSWECYSPTSSSLAGSVSVPLAWSRGLDKVKGTWPAADGTAAGSCWGTEGGHIVYGDGHVSWVASTETTGKNYFTQTDGTPTASWLASKSVPAAATLCTQN